MSDMSLADVLDAAADYIRTHGWHQGDLGFEGGPRCLIGAIDEAAQEEWAPLDAAVAHVSRCLGLRPLPSSKWVSAAKWNDRPERSADEVIDALMEAAARLRCEAP